ncbi:MAG: DUF3375 domain-containing protein [Planctomycetota bacterium]
MTTELTQRLIAFRRSHPAWLLLASTNGPLILGSLKKLIDAHPGGIDFEEAAQDLAAAYADHAGDSQFDFGDDPILAARREMRGWIKRRLIVERDGQLLATDALQRCFFFLESLEDQTMTSTASRLTTVQRAIESLETQLSSDPDSRAAMIETRIANLQSEFAAVRRGDFEVLSGSRAEEGIREVYQLAVSLRADFRRVEDSFRQADRELRARILSEQRDRGQIVDELLDGHDALLETVEGQVFDGFHQQLVQSAELEMMKSRLRSILENETIDGALSRKQKADLRGLVPRLVDESQRVIQARAQSERDVRGFLKSGLNEEHLRAGALVQEILRVALTVDWQSQRVRRHPSPLPPVAISLSNRNVVERFLVKQIDNESETDLDLDVTHSNPSQMEDEFWQAYYSLDRAQLLEDTLERLQAAGRPMTIGQLARELPPTHDLETLSFWLAMARQAGVELGDQDESFELASDDKSLIRFFVPLLQLDIASASELDVDQLE